MMDKMREFLEAIVFHPAYTFIVLFLALPMCGGLIVRGNVDFGVLCILLQVPWAFYLVGYMKKGRKK